MKRAILTAFLAAFVACAAPDSVSQKTVQTFLDGYNTEFQSLYYASAEAEWRSNTYIVEGDEETEAATKSANEAFASFTGSKENIEKATIFLKAKKELTPLQVKQLESILYAAANNPQTVPELVKQRIEAEAKQTSKLYGFPFKLNGDDVTTGELDRTLREGKNLDERLAAWEASKEVGTVLKDGLQNLRKLRNETVKALGYSDYFSYQVSDYGMTTKEMMEMNQRFLQEIRPLFRELHTYARYELAKRYGAQEVPEYLPAHWLPNRWGQDWSSMITVEGLDLNGALKDKSPEWIVREGEEFYKSIGLGPLPKSFYEKSDMYPLPEGTDYKKNNHASAWHMNLENDIRCLMSVEPTADYYETVHHELGHIYYYIAYTNPDVPLLLRGGANRAYHEGVGSLLGLAAMQKPFLVGRGLIAEDSKTDELRTLLREALNYIVFMPFSSGVMTEFEYELYSNNLPVDQYNAKWWELKKKHQGIVAPSGRGEEYCDAASKTHINNDAAQYYDYALSYVLLFQLHDHISRNILKSNPRATNYYGNKEVGAFLQSILSKGASEDWRKLMKETLGEELSASAMLTYFEPLTEYLKEQNKGRKHTL